MNDEQRKAKHNRLIIPAIAQENILVKTYWQIFDTNIPNKTEGSIIRKYFNKSLNKFKFKSGTIFFIFRIFSIVIVVIDRKNDTLTEVIPISGVKIIKPANRTIEPKR